MIIIVAVTRYFYFILQLKAYFRQNQIFTSIHVHVYYHNIHFRSQQMSLREEYYVNRVIVTKGQRSQNMTLAQKALPHVMSNVTPMSMFF